MNRTTRAALPVFTATILLARLAASAEQAAPVVFWGPDQTTPGDVVLLYGGGLRESKGDHQFISLLFEQAARNSHSPRLTPRLAQVPAVERDPQHFLDHQAG